MTAKQVLKSIPAKEVKLWMELSRRPRDHGKAFLYLSVAGICSTMSALFYFFD